MQHEQKWKNKRADRLAINYNKADTGVVVIAVILIVLVSILIFLINKKAYDKMDELEEL